MLSNLYASVYGKVGLSQ